MNLAFPYRFDGRGRTAEADDDQHLRDLIGQVLTTAPGERVNRPTFGCGVGRLVLAPNSEGLASATQFLVQGALQQWLGYLIVVNAVTVDARESTFTVSIRFTSRRTLRTETAVFTPGAGGA